MNLISLDIEATDSGEILELSIFQYKDAKEIYHSYFKPIHSDNWTNKAHHITPDMVKNAPSFRNERVAIQEIIKEADGIIGFALHNDVKYLEKHNIEIPSTVLHIEVQEWFWYYIGKDMDIDFGAVPRLSKCAEILGFNFSEDKDAHSATNDTHMTIKIFQKIIDKGCGGIITKESIKQFIAVYEAEKEKDAEIRAQGILSLHQTDKGYILKNKVYRGEKSDEVSIIVNSRYVAEHEIRDKFKRREIIPNSGIYNLKSTDFEFFLDYSNFYNPSKEEFYRHIYNAKKSKKKRLSFNIS